MIVRIISIIAISIVILFSQTLSSVYAASSKQRLLRTAVEVGDRASDAGKAGWLTRLRSKLSRSKATTDAAAAASSSDAAWTPVITAAVERGDKLEHLKESLHHVKDGADEFADQAAELRRRIMGEPLPSPASAPSVVRDPAAVERSARARVSRQRLEARITESRRSQAARRASEEEARRALLGNGGVAGGLSGTTSVTAPRGWRDRLPRFLGGKPSGAQ